MQLEKMYPGPDGAEFIKALVEGALPKDLTMSYIHLPGATSVPGQGEGTPHPQARRKMPACIHVAKSFPCLLNIIPDRGSQLEGCQHVQGAEVHPR